MASFMDKDGGGEGNKPHLQTSNIILVINALHLSIEMNALCIKNTAMINNDEVALRNIRLKTPDITTLDLYTDFNLAFRDFLTRY